jgi:hypothetical protein
MVEKQIQLFQFSHEAPVKIDFQGSPMRND